MLNLWSLGLTIWSFCFPCTFQEKICYRCMLPLLLFSWWCGQRFLGNEDEWKKEGNVRMTILRYCNFFPFILLFVTSQWTEGIPCLGQPLNLLDGCCPKSISDSLSPVTCKFNVLLKLTMNYGVFKTLRRTWTRKQFLIHAMSESMVFLSFSWRPWYTNCCNPSTGCCHELLLLLNLWIDQDTFWVCVVMMMMLSKRETSQDEVLNYDHFHLKLDSVLCKEEEWLALVFLNVFGIIMSPDDASLLFFL